MLLDIGLGIFAALFFASKIKVALSFSILIISILFALSPDLDFIIYAIHYKNFPGHSHRDLFHQPLLFIPLGSLIIYLVLGFNFAILFAVLSFAHFVHDTIGIGWGIQWLYPFSKNYLKLAPISKKINWWTRSEQNQMAKSYGDPKWFKNIYLRPTFISVVEFIVFLVAILILILLK